MAGAEVDDGDLVGHRNARHDLLDHRPIRHFDARKLLSAPATLFPPAGEHLLNAFPWARMWSHPVTAAVTDNVECREDCHDFLLGFPVVVKESELPGLGFRFSDQPIDQVDEWLVVGSPELDEDPTTAALVVALKERTGIGSKLVAPIVHVVRHNGVANYSHDFHRSIA